MKQYKKVLLGAVALMLAGAGCAAGTDESPRAISDRALKVGVMVPLSGDAASYGDAVRRGVGLALRDSGSENFQLVYEDSKCEGKDAAASASKLINIDQVDAIIGELCSGATLAAAPIAEQAGVVMISPASTAPTLTDAGDYIFRTVPSDLAQGSFGAQLIHDKGFSKLAVLYGNDDYGVGFEGVLQEAFPALGGEIVASEAVERQSTDVRAQLTKIKEAAPDALYIVSNSPDTIAASLKQVSELGLDVTIFGSEGLKSDDIVAAAQGAAEGMYVTSVSAGSADFTAAFEGEFGEAPGPFAAQAYDAMKAIIDSGADADGLKDALYDLSFEGVSGAIDFDENGDIAGSYEVFMVKDGAFVVQ